MVYVSDAQDKMWKAVENITFPLGMKAHIGQDYLQIYMETRCNVTGRMVRANGRKYRISDHATNGEITQTFLLACLQFSEHEIREQFKYRGQSIYDPHYDPERLVELRRRAESIQEREPLSTEV